MKLLSLKVENFRCIRTAKIDLADGLNVLYGPNDLGKSSLAHAIRAAFLLTTTATEYKAFVSWYAGGDPHVELVFETEPQQIWRVKKTFGTASAFLDFSKDAVDFSPECRGRQVDERLSEILRWGIAPPGGKGRPKGMPMTFLTAALLAEQDRVGAIFNQALADDSDESGKKQLISALHAMAEDPVFKTVLARVQERVDEAFNISDGKPVKKRGKNSPWVKLNEEIQRKQQQSHECDQELLKTTAIETEIQQLQDSRIDLKDAVNRAQESIDGLRQDLENDRRRREIAGRLEQRKARIAEFAKQLQELTDAQRVHGENAIRIADLTEGRQKADALRDAAAAHVRKEREKLDRLQSKDRARERQLEQSKLESRQNALRSEQLRQEASVSGIRAIESAAAKVAALESELRELRSAAAELLKRHDIGEQERGKLVDQEAELRGVRTLFRWHGARDLVQQAEKGLAQLNEWKNAAAAKRAEAAALESAQPHFALPSREQMDHLQRLTSDLRVAKAKMEVGLVITLRPKRPLRASIERDGERAVLYDLKDAALETSARRTVSVDLDGVAEIAISGGGADVRESFDALESRWATEARPLLQEARVSNIDELKSVVDETAKRAASIDAALREAAQLEQRGADQPQWAGILSERQQQLAALEQELGDSDLAKLDKAVRKLKLNNGVEVEKRLEALREKLDGLATEEKQRHSELAAANARSAEKQNALDVARAERDRAQAAIEGDWQDALRQVLRQQTEVAKELDSIEASLKRLTSEEDQGLAAAKKAVSAAESALKDSETACTQAQQRLTDATLAYATEAGALKAKQEASDKVDQTAEILALQQVEGELRAAPAPLNPVTDEMLAEAQRVFDAACNQLAEIDGRIQAKRGALQQVGGEVARQRAEDAAGELEAAKERAGQVELEYEAWELLRKTLREAEQEEGTHLGHALAEPIATRFAALTTGRYGKLALGPNLETEGISVAGENRLVDLLSVGTRDQLSTVFRLTLAEQLKTAVILDDQLAQSDSGRMLWVRELLKEVASKIQVIVFTCRPEDYAITTSGRGGKKRSDPEFPAHTVDLLKFIERSTA